MNQPSKDPLVSRELDERSMARAAYAAGVKPGAHIHISGICGTGTASVLQLLKQLGYYVTGSDRAFYPPMGDVVRATADKVFESFSADNLEPRPDLVVIGNALSRSNPEAEKVLQEQIPFASMPEVFAGLLIGSREHCPTSVVVTGTHGKTTTTTAVAWLLESAGRKPGYFIGGVPVNLPGSIRAVALDKPVNERIVVLEGDEYDSAFFAKYSKFHSYRPDVLIITSIEFDHADIYRNVEDIEAEFHKLVARVPKDGLILVADSFARMDALAARWRSDPNVQAQVLRYGTNPQSDFSIVSRKPWTYSEDGKEHIGQAVELKLPGESISLHLTVGGAYNAANLLAATIVARRAGVEVEAIQKGAEEFRGALRRQQVISDVGGVTVLEDFAHHPTAVAVTLAGIKEAYPNRRVICAFEPRSNTSRRNYFQKEYGQCFSSADVALLLEVADAGGYSGTDTEIKPLDMGLVLADLGRAGVEAKSFATVEELQDYIVRTAIAGDVIILMSNGAFGGLPTSLPAALKARIG